MYKSFTPLAIVIILLSGCSVKEVNENSFGTEQISSQQSLIPPVPPDWIYYDCPKEEYCGTLKFPFPKESNGPLEIQEGNVFGGYGINHISFIISETVYRLPDLEERARCMDMSSEMQQGNCPHVKQYLIHQPSYSILKFTPRYLKQDDINTDLIMYLIKTKDKDFSIRGHAKTLDDQKFLDITMLNLKIENDSSESSSK